MLVQRYGTPRVTGMSLPNNQRQHRTWTCCPYAHVLSPYAYEQVANQNWVLVQRHGIPRESGILLPNNQRQYRTAHVPKDVPYAYVLSSYVYELSPYVYPLRIPYAYVLSPLRI